MKSRYTSFLATLLVAGALALLPGTANAQGVNQFRNVPAAGIGPAGGGTVDVNSFAHTFPGTQVLAFGTFNNGIGISSAEVWDVSILPSAVGFTLVLTPIGPSATTAPTTMKMPRKSTLSPTATRRVRRLLCDPHNGTSSAARLLTARATIT